MSVQVGPGGEIITCACGARSSELQVCQACVGRRLRDFADRRRLLGRLTRDQEDILDELASEVRGWT